MKWIAMTLTVLALVFVFGAMDVQAQPGGPGGGGGGCTDPAGAPIPCPDDEPTTDDNGEPCDDTDRDGVCDSEEPDDCVGQANEDGDGCELPSDASPRELLIGLINTFEPVLPRDEGHKGWSDLMGLTVDALERLNFVFSPCDGEPLVDWIELASRGDEEAMDRLDDAIKQCTRKGTWSEGDFNGDGMYSSGDWLSFRIVADFIMYSACDPTGFCHITTFRSNDESDPSLFLMCDPTGLCAVSPSDDQRPGSNTTCDSAGNCIPADPTPEPTFDPIDDMVILPGSGVGARPKSRFQWVWSNSATFEPTGTSTASDETVAEFDAILRGLQRAAPEYAKELRIMSEAFGQWDRRVNNCQATRGSVTGKITYDDQVPPPGSAQVQHIHSGIVEGCPPDPNETADGEVNASDFLVWNVAQGDDEAEFCMMQVQIPGTGMTLVVLVEKPEVMTVPKRIYVGNLPFASKPGSEFDGDVED